MKKAYQKPDVTYIDFYSKEAITDISLEEGIALSNSENRNGNVSGGIGGSVGNGDNPNIPMD